MELAVLVNSRDEDTELIRKCQAGDEGAFETLVKKYQHAVFNLIYHFAAGVQETEDIAQKVFAKVYFSLDKFKLGRSFYPWLCRITINQCYDELRQWKRRNLVTFSDLEAEDPLRVERVIQGRARLASAADKDQIKHMVNTVLDALPKEYKTVLILREVEGLSYEEVAGIMGCSVQAARLRVFRARVKMRKALERLLRKHKISI